MRLLCWIGFHSWEAWEVSAPGQGWLTFRRCRFCRRFKPRLAGHVTRFAEVRLGYYSKLALGDPCLRHPGQVLDSVVSWRIDCPLCRRDDPVQESPHGVYIE